MAEGEGRGRGARGGRALAAAGCVAAAALLVAAALYWGPELWAFFTDGDAVRAWVDAQGPLAPAAIATVGRIPSVVTSTLAAGFASQGDWVAAGATLAVTVAFVGAGAAAYAAVRRREAAR